MKTKTKTQSYQIELFMDGWWSVYEKNLTRDQAREYKHIITEQFPFDTFRIAKVTHEVTS